MLKVPGPTAQQIQAFVGQGDEAMRQGDYETADKAYLEAFRLLPEPKLMVEGGVSVFTARVDVALKKKEYEKVTIMIENMMALHKSGFLEGIIGNPYLHLRLGQAQLELGNEKRAKDELARAFMGGGGEIFEGEDPKYFKFIRRFWDLGN